MAITITQSPQIITPSDNPVTWVFESDQTAQVNFYFIVEVQIANPTTFATIERHKIFPEVGNVAHFDASSITERYASVNNRTLNQVLPQVKINIIEYYNGSVGSSTLSSVVGIFKSRLKKKAFVNYVSSDYSLLSATGVKFMTLEPRGTVKVKQADLKYLTFINALSVAITSTYKTYTSAGTLVDTQSESLGSGYWNTFSVGIDRLETDLSLSFVGASYYTIEVTSSTGAMEVFRIDLDASCIYSTATRVHFLNTLGGIDSYTFGLLTREKTEVESFGYERQFGNFNTSSAFVYDVKDGTVIDFLKTSSKSLEVTSDWMKENVQNWLSKELYMSPIVWTEEDAELYRCKVTNKSYDKKIQETDMLFQEVAKIELETETSVHV